jgi:Protein of unknown function (DUF3891)
MIRRNRANNWLLISQREHARIAAELADGWNDSEVIQFPHRSELLSAIRHHDDGWAVWESKPTINDDGEPREFTEMPMSDATSIWSRSIDICADSVSGTVSSAYGGLWVSRHFCYLAEGARDSRHSTTDLDSIDDFLSRQTSLQKSWRQQVGTSVENARACEEQGFHWLQTFDRISLWLCCADRSDRWDVALPSGYQTAFVPQADGPIALEPFPFREAVTLSVDCLRLPRQTLRDNEQLRLTIQEAQEQTIAWRLVPSVK